MRLKRCLCGQLLCSKKSSTYFVTFCILDSSGPSYEVDGHIKPPLCRFSLPSSKCYIFSTKSWPCPRTRWRILHSLGAKRQPVGLSLGTNCSFGPARSAHQLIAGNSISGIELPEPLSYVAKPLLELFSSLSIHRSIHPNLHPEQLPWFCIAIFISSSVFWVAGGFSPYGTIGEQNRS